MKQRILICLFFLATWPSFAGEYVPLPSGIKATIGSTVVEIRFYNASTVRILKWPVGTTGAKESLSVIKTPEKTTFKLTENGERIALSSQRIQTILNLTTGKIVFKTARGADLLTEKDEGTQFTPFDDAGEKTYRVEQAFVLGTDDVIYGLGQQQQGRMVQRNLELRMVQGNTDDYIPFFLSGKGYGLFWDNYSPTIFSDSPDQTSFRSEVADCIDYYLMYGGNADGVIAQMRNLTGQVPMFPLWTYGFWQSRERYRTQNELLEVVRKFRELQVPLDGIIQDWQYWGNNYQWNAMEFLNPGFSDPRKMVDDVHALNAHVIISIWSSFGPMTKQYQEMEPQGMLFGLTTWPQSGSEAWPPNKDYPSGVRVYDAYHPGARDIYWKYLNQQIFSLGMDGWWMDSTEPDHLDVKPEDFNQKTYLGSFRKVRNAYPLMAVGGVSDHQRSVGSGKRVFILTRSAFAGQQRYGANTWSGDVVASWEALRNQISAGLNFSLCAIPYWNSDIGGFFLWNFENPLQNPDYRELQVRWMQFGTFCPMMRSHGEGYPRELYQFGQKGDPVYDALEKYINLRYRLLPYIYAASWEVTSKQSTMMRALVMDFPDDKQALDINDEFMFGKSILVCPVTEPQYNSNGKADFSTVKSRELYLPKGTGWIDFWTGAKLTGGQKVQKETPLDVIPLYVKTGAILPVGPAVQYATEKKWDNLEIQVYEGADGEFTLYEDENDNDNYKEGAYSTITFTWVDRTKTLTIGERKGQFPGMLNERQFKIVVPGDGSGHPKTVRYSGKSIQIKL